MKKLLSASNIIACLTAVLTLITLILYGINFASAGFYQGVAIKNIVLLGIFAIVFSLGIIGLSLVPVSGIAKKAVDVVAMVFKVLIPVFLFLIVFAALNSRIEGLGYIFFSNVDVRQEVATPANVASATLAIVTIVFAAVAAVAGIVGAFFLPKEEEKTEAVEA